MAIIRPSKKFAGSEFNNKNSSKYIKEGVRQVLFGPKENKEGAYLYFLPPYTTDASGAGVWYKVFKIRDNFGTTYKEKYAVKGFDAVDHFERNFKIHFPEEAKVVDEVDDSGKTRKRYPSYGRKTNRVIYNVAYVNKLGAGCHILDLPVYMGASQITEWLDAKDARGKEKPMLNDASRCIPVFVKLKDGGSGNPWQIQPDPSDEAELPDFIADSDNLYNLDTDVLDYRSDADLIEKLREMYRPEIFDLCMDGFPGLTNTSAVSMATVSKLTSSSAAKPIVEKKESSVTPALKNMKMRPAEEEDNLPMDYVEDETPPVPASAPKTTAVSVDKVASFLRDKRRD